MDHKKSTFLELWWCTRGILGWYTKIFELHYHLRDSRGFDFDSLNGHLEVFQVPFALKTIFWENLCVKNGCSL